MADRVAARYAQPKPDTLDVHTKGKETQSRGIITGRYCWDAATAAGGGGGNSIQTQKLMTIVALTRVKVMQSLAKRCTPMMQLNGREDLESAIMVNNVPSALFLSLPTARDDGAVIVGPENLQAMQRTRWT